MTQPAPVPTAPPGDPAQPPTTPPAPNPAPQPAPTQPAGDPPADDKPLGPAGERALAAERDARKALEKQIAELAPLKKIADMLGAGTPAAAGKSEIELLNERFAQHEKTIAGERAARFRAEVANEKGLTAQQAEWLRGDSKEELAASADQLVALFPAAAASGPRTPAPDPSQGARGGQPANLEAQIAEATAKGDVGTVIALQRQKLVNSPRT